MKSKLFPKTVPGVEELLDMATFFYQLDCPRAFFDMVMNDAKGLHDGKRRLLVSAATVVNYLQDILDEHGIEHPVFDFFDSYNDLVERYKDDPEGSARRELAALPLREGESVEGMDPGQVPALVVERLRLNRTLPPEAVPSPRRKLLPMPSREVIEAAIDSIAGMTHDREQARMIVESALQAHSNHSLALSFAPDAYHGKWLTKTQLESLEFARLLLPVVRYTRNATPGGISSAIGNAIKLL